MADTSPSQISPPGMLTLQILDALAAVGECDMEALVEKCAPSTWNAVFFEVDRLTRIGQIRLSYRENGVYAVSLPRVA